MFQCDLVGVYIGLDEPQFRLPSGQAECPHNQPECLLRGRGWPQEAHLFKYPPVPLLTACLLVMQDNVNYVG